jgi:hypothetical protein
MSKNLRIYSGSFQYLSEVVSIHYVDVKHLAVVGEAMSHRLRNAHIDKTFFGCTLYDHDSTPVSEGDFESQNRSALPNLLKASDGSASAYTTADFQQ